MSQAAHLTRERLDVASLVASVARPGAGAVVTFVGTVRDNSEVGRVDEIDYEAYEPMAEKTLRQIEDDVSARWPECRARLVHRIGRLGVGEASVAVVVSAPHRGDAFEACREAIERVKHEVPIWKKERLSDGTARWVEGNRVAPHHVQRSSGGDARS